MCQINKKELTEEDIKLRYITPAITKQWSLDRISMERAITDGKIELKGNLVARKAPKKADYILYIKPNNPIAIVESKDNKHSVSAGMQQAMTYAQMLNVPFAYSSNGDAFQEHDFITGMERTIPLSDFPSPEELFARYKKGLNLTEAEEKIMDQPYYTGQGVHEPRYYQQNAINKTLDAIVKGQDRILLVMATGTGKTYTAFQIVWRLLKSGLKRKILYLADRNILVDQSVQQDFSPLEKTIHKINFKADSSDIITSYEVYFSLYQQLAGDDDAKETDEEISSRLEALFRPDFFDLVIVDECHRGSAKENSNWRKILEYFKSATQIGMTATPRETDEVSNIDYFGKPVYTYSLREGIDDGFLAPFRVINIRTNIGDGWRPVKGQTDIYGNEIEDRLYTNADYDYNIVIKSRIHEVAKEITNYLKQTDRMQKTIVFCADEAHAERMRIELNNLNSDMVQQNPDYVVRITGSDQYGKGKLDYFVSVGSPYPVIATTSKLLSTGVDCKMTKLIVLDQKINSMTEFKQIIGRGTRLREREGKTHFVVMDFRNVTRLFADPDWDGPVEQSDGFDPNNLTVSKPLSIPTDGSKDKPIVDADGCSVRIIGKSVSVYDSNGKLLRQEDVIDYTKNNIIGKYASLEKFICGWSSENKKGVIRSFLHERGIDLDKIKSEQNMTDVDDFDFICHLAFDQKPLTRKERAENVKKRDYLNKYKGDARAVLEILLDKYMNEGIYEIETTEVLNLEPFQKYGKPSKIVQLFGGKDGYLQAVRELENELYQRVA